MKKILFYIFSLLLVSCNSGFLKEYSQDLARVQSFSDLDELVVGEAFLPTGMAYNTGYSVSLYNTNYLLLHYMTDELEENLNPPTNPDAMELGYRTIMFPYFTWQQDVNLDYEKKNTQESQEASYWNSAYTHIAACNMIMAETNKLNVSSEEDEALYNKINGEVHFLRAIYYYTLVNLYAQPYQPATAATTPGVPVKITEYIEDKEYQRNSVEEVYRQIVSDLSDAEKFLANIHTPVSIHRVGINAVYLMRSRVALYMQDWETAKKYAELSLGENKKLLSMLSWPETESPMNGDNPENVFAMGGATFGYTEFLHPGGDYYGTPYSPVFKVSDHLYNLYDEKDARKTTFFSTQYGIGNAPYVTKIDYSDNSLSSYSQVSDQFYLRSAEAYLNLAEAYAELGQDGEAIKYLDELRKKRIRDAIVTNASGGDLIKLIREEREREFCFEGQRWYDMRRYTVDAKWPQVETVTHTFTSYINKSYQYVPSTTVSYELKTNDGGMVLNIPKNVRDFQNSIGGNERPLRNVVFTKVYN